MEWINQKTRFSGTDRGRFAFNEDANSCQIRTIVISKPQDGALTIEEKDLDTAEEYEQWIDECDPLSETQCPTLVLVIHQRLDGENGDPVDLPYGETTFKKACKKLFQHRSITNSLHRKSTVIFNSRLVHWGFDNPGKSRVYNCVSDTISLGADDDIILSTTSFSYSRFVYGVFYGCTEKISETITTWVEECGEIVFHPMILPMIFVELERQRLLNNAAAKGTELNQKVIELETRSKTQGQDSFEKEKKGQGDAAGDSEIVKMLLSMNGMKNGLEGLHEQLSSMRDHLGRPSETTLSDEPDEDSPNYMCSVNIDLRLKEIMTEIRNKVRSYEGLLGAITLATQMEATDFTRTDSWVNFTIAKASKRDSTQMRFISLMGMVFLPGTFLATLFSMTFFNWTPSGSDQILSPWVALYFGLTIITTAFTIWFWKGRSSHEEWDEEDQFMRDLGNASRLMNLATNLKRSNSLVHLDVAQDDISEVEVKTPLNSSHLNA